MITYLKHWFPDKWFNKRFYFKLHTWPVITLVIAIKRNNELRWLRLFHKIMQKLSAEAQISVDCRINNFQNIWQLWYPNLRLPKIFFCMKLYSYNFSINTASLKSIFSFFFSLIYWRTLFALCFSSIHYFGKNLLNYNFHFMKNLGLTINTRNNRKW